MALVIALVMLGLLSILGALAISTSTTELRITGNYRSLQDSFNLADSGLEYGSTADTIYTSLSGKNTWPSGPGSKGNGYNNVNMGADFPAAVRVEVLLRDQPAPIGAGYDNVLTDLKLTTSKFDYLTVKSIGTSVNNTETSIEGVIMRAK